MEKWVSDMIRRVEEYQTETVMLLNLLASIELTDADIFDTPKLYMGFKGSKGVTKRKRLGYYYFNCE